MTDPRNHADALSYHVPGYVQDTDPGTVGAGKLWVDTTGSAPFPMKIRNEGNTGWDLAGGGAGIANGGNATGDDIIIGTLDDFNVIIYRNGVNVGHMTVDTFFLTLSLSTTAGVAATGNIHSLATVTGDANVVSGNGVFAAAEVQAGTDLKAADRVILNEVQILTNQLAAVADVASADAPSQTGSYVQADVQAIADLLNEVKAQLNTLLDRQRTHGIIAS